MHYYMCGPRSGHVRNSIALPCIFDFRWAFPSAAAARDFYDLISEEMTEEGNPPPAAKMRRLAGSLPGLPADADCLLLGDKDGHTRHSDYQSLDTLTSGTMMSGASSISFNAIFRVERVCAKVYAMLTGPPSLFDEAEQALKLRELAGKAAARVVMACKEPMSVACVDVD